MHIKIPPYIVSNTYCTQKTTSVSFIDDLKHDLYYILCGETSALWEFIINFPDYNKILRFAQEHNMQQLLGSFLSELKFQNLIEADFVEKSCNNRYLKYIFDKKSSNFNIFLKYKEFALREKLTDLRSVRLSLNYTCNLNCKQCCNPKDIYEEMTFEQAKAIIDEAIDLGVYLVSLSGGECTINKDFLNIAKYVRSKFLDLTILTNAQKLYDDNKLLNDIISIYPGIQVSLYSMIPEVHDNLTGKKGSHYKTLHVIKKLRENNIKVAIACVQFSYNRGSWIDVKKYADKMGCDFVTDCKFIYNTDNDNLDAKLSKEDIFEYYLNTINVNKPRSKEDLICSAGNDRLEIMPNLDINPCSYFYYKLGNYKNVTLKEVRETTVKEFHKLFKKENLKDCYKYDYCKYCLYCPKYCKSSEKNVFLKKNEILCEDAKMYSKALLHLQSLKSNSIQAV